MPGATLLSDGFSSYRGLAGFTHRPKVVGSMAAHIVLPWIHRVFANFKRWALGTYDGVRKPHLAATSTTSLIAGTGDATCDRRSAC